MVKKNKSTSAETGLSQNKVVKCFFSKAIVVSTQKSAEELSKFSGIWTEEEYSEFNRSTSPFANIDEDLWK